ncbi:HutD family protein [uncultured Agrobacterium sp.]|uniref:HutD/Ves family protein n=1 Tax=uncultured Agrobacterium sp. TaxID=157277 RepID=UPI0025DC82ED|nr:HutD family protein [uncultured Agrobacterium sp.]
MKRLSACDYKRMPWKNGKGETVEIAVFPPGAAMDAFEWRISMASVANDGAFSLFPEIDRTLSILWGHGMSLTIDGAAPVLLTMDSDPLRFAADVPVDATLVDGAITDLNVMTRRGRFVHRVERRAGSFSVRGCERGETVYLLATGPVTLTSQKDTVQLEEMDCVLFEEGASVKAENIVCYEIRFQEAV